MVERLPGHAYIVAAVIFIGAVALLIKDFTSLFVG